MDQQSLDLCPDSGQQSLDLCPDSGQQSLDLRPDSGQPPQYFVVTLSTVEPAGRHHQMIAVERYGIAKRSATGGFTVIDDVRTKAFAQARCEALNSGLVTG